jgi:hypothetical protein
MFDGFYLVVGRNNNDEKSSKDQIALGFKNLIEKLGTGKESLRLDRFRSAFHMNMPDLNNSHYHDAFEFPFQFCGILREDIRLSR